jgi:hypothetical protein
MYSFKKERCPLMYWMVLIFHAGIVDWLLHTMINLDRPLTRAGVIAWPQFPIARCGTSSRRPAPGLAASSHLRRNQVHSGAVPTPPVMPEPRFKITS